MSDSGKKNTIPLELVVCEDGSTTLYRNDLGEHYHSVYGALSESVHIFIDAGFSYLSRFKSKINLLEMGFGTGLNAFLTFLKASESGINVNYTGIESVRLSDEIIAELNYSDLTKTKHTSEIFSLIHACEWEQKNDLSSFFSLYKMESKIQDITLKKEYYDLVYFDAFAPDVQPELWTVAIFEKIYDSMTENGAMLTYSCKGDVKRAMKSAGFSIEKLPGPKGKREFLRAIKV